MHVEIKEIIFLLTPEEGHKDTYPLKELQEKGNTLD
jgi:hypothetical protein